MATFKAYVINYENSKTKRLGDTERHILIQEADFCLDSRDGKGFPVGSVIDLSHSMPKVGKVTVIRREHDGKVVVLQSVQN